MKKLKEIAKEILAEISVNNPSEIPIPNGWTEQLITAEDQDYHPENKDEPGYYEVINRFSAPMEGWDSNHDDVIIIKKDKKGYFVEFCYAFGDCMNGGRFSSFYEVKKAAVDEMETLKEEWEVDDIDYDEEEED